MRLCLSLLLFAAPLATAAPPNIVFIYADDLGWTDLGCYGSAYYETPNIDRLAREGMRFTRYYTTPNCAPSRAALMTGQYAPRTGIYTVASAERGRAEDRAFEVPENLTDLPLDREILADVLQRAQYKTAIFGKWHLGFEGGHFPTERGFDEAQVVARNAYYDFTTLPPVEDQKGQYLTDYLTDRAVDFLHRSKEERFFLYLPHLAVHTPIVAKPDYVEAWEDREAKGTHWNPTYAAMLQSLDESVGRVLDTLDELGLTESTLVIFTSDNGGLGGYYRTEPPSEEKGYTDNAPLRGGKGTLYEGGVRVPFIARWPGEIEAGTENDTPIAHIDMLPTLSAIAGAEPPKHTIDGVNITGLFRGEDNPVPPRPLFLHFPAYLESYVHDRGWRTTPGSFILSGPWKLIEFFGAPPELYQIEQDPGEHHNVAADHPEVVERLVLELEAWREATDAAMPAPKSQDAPAAP